jgi:hypothetical protein
MTDVGSRWSEVGERLEALALKLKLHFEQTGGTQEAPDALQKLRTSVTEAFEAAGNAVKDDAVKADVRETGRLFLDAVSASLAKASENIKDKSENLKGKTDTAPSAPTDSIESKPTSSE